MISVTNLRNGAMFMHQDDPYKVLEYTHTKTARGGATIRVKSQNILNGVIKDITFNNGDKVEEADIENVSMQFLYSDQDFAYFMNMETYTQVEIPRKYIENEIKFLIEEKSFQVMFFQGKAISVTLPPSLFYTVTEAPLAVKGNTANNATKEVVLENGLAVQVPQFIKKGDVLKINTDTGEYINRGR